LRLTPAHVALVARGARDVDATHAIHNDDYARFLDNVGMSELAADMRSFRNPFGLEANAGSYRSRAGQAAVRSGRIGKGILTVGRRCPYSRPP